MLIVSLQDDTRHETLPVSVARTLSVARQNTYACLGSNKVSGFDYQRTRSLTFASHSPVAAELPGQEGQDATLSLLNTAIETLDLAKETSDITSAKVAFGCTSALLTMIRVRHPYNRMFRAHINPELDDR